jgi:hypothetical protein
VDETTGVASPTSLVPAPATTSLLLGPAAAAAAASSALNSDFTLDSRRMVMVTGCDIMTGNQAKDFWPRDAL